MSRQRDPSLDPLRPPPRGLTRRGFVGRLPLALIAAHALLHGLVWAQALDTGQLIVRRAPPVAAEMLLTPLESWLTLHELFCINTVLAEPLPSIDLASWRLSMVGQVELPLARWLRQ
jgi:DMSO/TMAO reductase YedYZ molybdopterin-dependent catalytic subunit